MQSQQYPGTSPWLSAKVIGLVVYILLGVALMRLARTRRQQVLALLGAILCFGYIVAVALTRCAIPFD